MTSYLNDSDFWGPVTRWDNKIPEMFLQIIEAIGPRYYEIALVVRVSDAAPRYCCLKLAQKQGLKTCVFKRSVKFPNPKVFDI